MKDLLLGLFIGVNIGFMINQWVFPLLDTVFQVFQFKQTDKATFYQLASQEQVALFNREYPELNTQNPSPELQPAIGFTYTPPPDEIMYYEEDEECKNQNINQIKNINKIGY